MTLSTSPSEYLIRRLCASRHVTFVCYYPGVRGRTSFLGPWWMINIPGLSNASIMVPICDDAAKQAAELDHKIRETREFWKEKAMNRPRYVEIKPATTYQAAGRRQFAGPVAAICFSILLVALVFGALFCRSPYTRHLERTVESAVKTPVEVVR